MLGAVTPPLEFVFDVVDVGNTADFVSAIQAVDSGVIQVAGVYILKARPK